MTDQQHPFTPGTEVMVQSDYSHYGAGIFKPDTVLKLHKTGRFTLASDPARQWSAQQSTWEGDKPWFGYPASGQKGYSIYCTRLRLLDDAAKAEYEEAKAKRDHEKRCKTIEEMFAKPSKVAPDLSAKIAVLIATPQPVQ